MSNFQAEEGGASCMYPYKVHMAGLPWRDGCSAMGCSGAVSPKVVSCAASCWGPIARPEGSELQKMPTSSMVARSGYG